MRKRRKIFLIMCVLLVLAVAVFLLKGCITSAQAFWQNLQNGGYIVDWSDEDGRVIEGLVYDNGKNLKYDLYLPKNIGKEKPVPLMLFIHGGSWTSGKRQDIAHACKYYAKHSCITATLDYSLASKKHPEVTIYTMLDDITACIGAIKNKLTEEGFQTPKIALSGFSAGGHLALLYAYSRAEESPIPIAFVFEKVGPTDLGEKGFGAEMAVGLVLYGTGKQIKVEDLNKPEGKRLVDSISPASCVTEKSVPTIFAYGGKDDLVKRCHRDILADALEKNGVPHIEVNFPNSHHGMWSDPDKTEEFRKAVLSYCDNYMP
ncbi:MAG: alpha/beta hydrolase fold domain-containing protein [Thermoguttaceae bacterium]